MELIIDGKRYKSKGYKKPLDGNLVLTHNGVITYEESHSKAVAFIVEDVRVIKTAEDMVEWAEENHYLLVEGYDEVGYAQHIDYHKGELDQYAVIEDMSDFETFKTVKLMGMEW